MTDHTPQWLKAFPDFDPIDMPDMPEGFVDNSYRNDICPCYWSEALRLQIFIDYSDKAKREYSDEGIARFSVHTETADGSIDQTLLATDDWQEVLAVILARHFVAVITDWLTPEEMAAVKKENAARNDETCATHDFCDANMAMFEAFQNCFDRDPIMFDDLNPANQEDIDLWNAAWDRAKLESLS